LWPSAATTRRNLCSPMRPHLARRQKPNTSAPKRIFRGAGCSSNDAHQGTPKGRTTSSRGLAARRRPWATGPWNGGRLRLSSWWTAEVRRNQLPAEDGSITPTGRSSPPCARNLRLAVHWVVRGPRPRRQSSPPERAEDNEVIVRAQNHILIPRAVPPLFEVSLARSSESPEEGNAGRRSPTPLRGSEREHISCGQRG
jgi:hypothetical protein